MSDTPLEVVPAMQATVFSAFGTAAGLAVHRQVVGRNMDIISFLFAMVGSYAGLWAGTNFTSLKITAQ